MKRYDFSNLLFRASANGEINTPGTGEITEKQLETLADLVAKSKIKDLTEKQDEEMRRLTDKKENPTLSQTCIKRLIKLFAKEYECREELVTSKYMTKGSVQEDTSITLYSRVRKKAFFKNEKHLTNKYVQGTPDLGDEEDIEQSEEITDLKSSWSRITYLNAKFSDTDFGYQTQGDTYMALIPKAKRFRLAYCLVNSPAQIILSEKKSLMWQMPDVIDHESDEGYREACKQIEINHIFDIHEFVKENPGFDFHNDIDEWDYDIEMTNRVFEIIIERDNDRINKLYNKVERCRKWLDENFNK